MFTNSSKNATKVWLFIIGVCLTFLFVGYHFGGRLGLFVGFLLSVGVNALIFLFGESSLLQYFSAYQIRGQDSWGINTQVKDFCDKWQLSSPLIYIAPIETPTAFCTGLGLRKAVICLSEGLLKNFTQEEITSVLAHQLCHIRRMDNFAFGVTSTISNALMGLGMLLDKVWPLNWFKQKQSHVFLNLMMPIGWLVIRIVVSSKTYFENDKMAGQLMDDDRRIGEILWRLEGISQTRPLHVPPCTHHLFVVNPDGFAAKSFFSKFHPAMNDRLRKLMGYYPI